MSRRNHAKLNRKRRKAIKLARKHGRDIYTARNPFWQAQPQGEADITPEALVAAFRALYAACQSEPPQESRTERPMGRR